jgi:hypothetical protein
MSVACDLWSRGVQRHSPLKKHRDGPRRCSVTGTQALKGGPAAHVPKPPRQPLFFATVGKQSYQQAYDLSTAFRSGVGGSSRRATFTKFGSPNLARQIDENEALPYKPRQLSAMARLDRGRLIWPEMAFSGPTSITGLHLINRQIARSAENHP